MRPRWLLLLASAPTLLAALALVAEVRSRRELAQVHELVSDQGRRVDRLLRNQEMMVGLALASAQAARPREALPAPTAVAAPPAPAAGEAAAPASATAGVALPPEKVAEAVRQTRTLGDEALARGRWDERDRLELDQRLWMLPRADAEALVGQVVAAVNAGKIDVQTTSIF